MAFILSLFCCVVLFLTVSHSALLPKKAHSEVPPYDLKGHFDTPSFKQIDISGKYNDCLALRPINKGVAGLYNIYLNGTYKAVRCYYNGTKAYTIIQQRIRGDTDFDRGLSKYRAGFGNAVGDHWFGLDNIRSLVQQGNTQLQIVMTSWSSQTFVANYNYFSIGDYSQGYALSIGGYSGPFPDDMSYSNGQIFYTNDVPDPNGCAVNQRGGWWYNYCSYAFLNGYYYRGGKYTPPTNFYDGIYWKDWLGYDYSLMQVTMAVSH